MTGRQILVSMLSAVNFLPGRSMWSFYVGRPESLDEKHIFVQPLKASDIVQDATSCWRPYIEEGHNQDSISLPGLLGDVAQYTVSLCRKMSHVRRVL